MTENPFMGWEGWPPTTVVIVTLVLGLIFEVVFCIGFWQFWCVRSATHERRIGPVDRGSMSVAGRVATQRSLWKRQPRPRAMRLKQLQMPPKISWRISRPHRRRAVGTAARQRASSGCLGECCRLRELLAHDMRALSGNLSSTNRNFICHPEFAHRAYNFSHRLSAA